MKKLLFLFCYCLLISVSGQAQTNDSKMAIGLQSGIHNSWTSFTGTTALARGYLAGFHGGVQFQYMSRPMLGFETNVLYTNIGWEEPSLQGNYTRKIQAIEWQLNTHLSIGKGIFRLLADAGPYLRFFLGENINGPADLPQYSLPLQNNFQYGLLVGGGLGARLARLIIQLRGHFHLGLTNFFDSDLQTFLISSDRTAGGSLSVMIPFGN